MKTKFIIPSTVIINADDFGLNSKRNLAITECFQKGLVNSTSIMSNMPLFKEAILLAKNHNFHHKIGLHVCFTEGKALTDLSNTSLVDKNGFFIKKQIYRPTIYFSGSVMNKLKKEVEAQLVKLYNEETTPTHLNTHHDIHELPWLLPIFLSVAKRHNIKLRVSQIWMNGKNPLKPLYRKLVNHIYVYNNLNFTDFFETLEVYKKKRLEKINPHQITEIMVHPDLDKNWKITDSIVSCDLEKCILNISKK